jgi:hypothetical protein
MSYIGNQPSQVAFVTDSFSGNGSTTAFTMSVAPANTASVLVAVSGVLQDPSTYSVSGTTLTFSAAPPTGTSNISARYLGIPASGVTTTAYRTITEFTATAGQTTFTPPSYTVGFIEVNRNGVLLGSADYTATNGTTVVLTSGAVAGDLITTVSFYVSSVLNAIPATAGSVSPNYLSQPFTQGTVVNSTSGTAVTYTSIPSWVKRITIMFNGVSLSGSANFLIQIGAGSTTSSGYNSTGMSIGSAVASAGTTSTSGFIFWTNNASNLSSGQIILTNLTGNTWVCSGNLKISSYVSWGAGDVALSGTLDRVIITTSNGTDTFDAGSINILYE